MMFPVKTRSATSMTSRVLVVTVLLAALVGLAGREQTVALAQTGPSAQFDWRMPDRYGLDRNGDGLVDLSTLTSFVFPATWQVKLDACTSSGGSSPVSQYKWEIRGPGIAGTATQIKTQCAFEFPFPEEGSYQVTLTVTTQAGGTAALTRAVVVEDWLIVLLGDSVASGDGNPDIPGSLPDGIQPVWQDRRCHRSALAGPALAALMVERSNPRTSVTFIDFACSGAKLTDGLLRPYAGIEPPGDGSTLPPQVDQVANLFAQGATSGHPRQVDALLISIGANDLGFSKIIASCIVFERCYEDVFGRLDDLEAWKILLDGLFTLPGRYAELATALSTRLSTVLSRDRVFITEYFDPSRSDSGEYCTGMLDSFTQDEIGWADQFVTRLLNLAILFATQAHGWNYVEGITAQFAKHGYCAQDHWIVHLEESIWFQGDAHGTLHPNLAGHLTYADRLFGSLVRRLSLQIATPSTQQIAQQTAAQVLQNRSKVATRVPPTPAQLDAFAKANGIDASRVVSGTARSAR